MDFSKVLVLMLSAFSFNLVASTQDEINHLLSLVATTDCKYIRNGTKHNGEAAFEHINKKYRYYSDKIKTAEDFIMYSATKSSISGKYYKIQCENKAAINSQDWLLRELTLFRESN